MLRILLLCCLLVPAAVASAADDKPLPAEQEALARRLLNSQGCKACHRFEGGTTDVGPGLEAASRNLTRTELTRSLKNPEGRHGKGLIPDFSHLQPEEIEALVAFLYNLPAKEESQNTKTSPRTAG